MDFMTASSFYLVALEYILDMDDLSNCDIPIQENTKQNVKTDPTSIKIYFFRMQYWIGDLRLKVANSTVNHTCNISMFILALLYLFFQHFWHQEYEFERP